MNYKFGFYFFLYILSFELFSSNKFLKSVYLKKNINQYISNQKEVKDLTVVINDIFVKLQDYLEIKKLECTGIIDIGRDGFDGNTILWETKKSKLSKSETKTCMFELYTFKKEIFSIIYKKRKNFLLVTHQEELKTRQNNEDQFLKQIDEDISKYQN